MENLPQFDDSMRQQQEDFYRKLRKKILEWSKTKDGSESEWIKYLLLAPDLFYLIMKLLFDPDVPFKYKRNLFLAITYFISPIDLISEAFVGPAGYADDIVVTVIVLNDLLNEVDTKVVLKHWPSDEDLIETIQIILRRAKEMVGDKIWQMIKKMFSTNGN